MVDHGDTWNVEETKNTVTKLQNLPNSATHEETFLAGCLKPPGHSHNRAEPIEENRKKRARLPAQSGQQQTGADGRNVRPRRQETSSKQTCGQDNSTKVTKGESKSSLIPWTRGKTTWRPQRKRKNKESSNPSKRTKMRGTASWKPPWTPPDRFRHFAYSCSEGRSCLMVRATCNCRHNRQSTSTREKRQRSWLSRPGACENLAMVPHQKRKSDTEGRLFVKWIPTGETLKNVFMEVWIKIGGNSSEGQKTMNAPTRITTMSHDSETPTG